MRVKGCDPTPTPCICREHVYVSADGRRWVLRRVR